MISFVLPIRTVPGLNAREHWAVRMKRVKAERQQAHLLSKFAAKQLKNLAHMGIKTPLVITLTRIKPRGPRADSDQVPGALKAIRDGIADALGINDGDETKARWEYAQEHGRWGVRVDIRETP